MQREKGLVAISYALIYLVWGSTYFFIKAAVETIPAPMVLAFRFLSGGLLLLAFGAARGGLRIRPTLRQVAGSCLTGTLLLLLGNGLITLAEKNIPSYAASLIAACMPFFVSFFNFALYRRRVSAVRLLGVAVGVAGVGLLLFDGSSLEGTFSAGILIAVAGAAAWSLGTSTGASTPRPEDSVISTAIQMLWAGALSLALAPAIAPGSLGNLGEASAWSWFGVGYLALMGSAALVAYNYLLARESTFRLSSYALVNPLIAVFLGIAAGEAATPFLLAGLPLALAGLALMLYGDKLRDLVRGAGKRTAAATEPEKKEA